MNPLVLQYRKLRRTVQDVRGYLDLDRRGNEIVRRTDFHQCPKPVLLLYGFFGTRRSFEVLERRLRRDGYCVFSINLGGLFDAFNTHGIDASAEKVRDKVESLYARYHLGPLSIIGFSKGGLIGRYYVKRLGGDKRVQNLVTLGTPHNGSPTAYWGIATVGAFARSVWQMTPMSPFIRRLKMGAFPAKVRFTSIYSKADHASPFPACISGQCVKPPLDVMISFQANTTAFTGFQTKFTMMQVRFVKKAAIDGSTVNCDIVKAAAPGKAGGDANQLEASHKFNVQAYESLRINNGVGSTAGYPVFHPLLHSAVGGSFLIWTELWTGGRDSSTSLPNGNRVGWSCVESGLQVAEIKAEDDCSTAVDGGAGTTCRTIVVDMPGIN